MSQFLNSAPLLLDGALCLILLVGFIIGAKKGLLCSLLGVVIFVAAFAGASWGSNVLTDPVTEWAQPKVEQRIMEKMASAMGATVEQSDLSGLNLNGLNLNGIDAGTLQSLGLGDQIKELLNNARASGQTMLFGALHSIIRQMVHAALFLVIFLVLLLVLWLVTRPLRLATYVSVFKTVDTIGGGILGLAGGVILAFVVAWAARKLGLISSDTVAQTYIVRRFLSGEYLEALMAIGQKS